MKKVCKYCAEFPECQHARGRESFTCGDHRWNTVQATVRQEEQERIMKRSIARKLYGDLRGYIDRRMTGEILPRQLKDNPEAAAGYLRAWREIDTHVDRCLRMARSDSNA